MIAHARRGAGRRRRRFRLSQERGDGGNEASSSPDRASSAPDSTSRRPTTVIGELELRQGQRSNLQQVLNDSPQFRPTTTTQVSAGNTSSGSAPVDLRGLGANRTLTPDQPAGASSGRTTSTMCRWRWSSESRSSPAARSAALQLRTRSRAWSISCSRTRSKAINLGVQSGISSRGDGSALARTT